MAIRQDEQRPADTRGSPPGQIPLRRDRWLSARTGDPAPKPVAVRQFR
ncbi:hypothetical protein ACFY3M_27160 [Streptomyces mirabilis]